MSHQGRYGSHTDIVPLLILPYFSTVDHGCFMGACSSVSGYPTARCRCESNSCACQMGIPLRYSHTFDREAWVAVGWRVRLVTSSWLSSATWPS